MSQGAWERAEQRLGKVVRGKWVLETVLGVGGMAAVYAGRHQRIGRLDALKILHPEAAQSREIRERFEREAHAANRFKHKGAVEIRDIDITEEGEPFLVMEFLVGEALSERDRRPGGIPMTKLLQYMDEVLDTLCSAHAHGIIHRDIKPSNLFVREDGSVKVLDFGLARVRAEQPFQLNVTKAGVALGTTPYMAPEQARGMPIDVRADIFGVGATMFRLITGRHVHVAKKDTELLNKMAKEPAPPIATIAPKTPSDVCLIVDRALAFHADRRYPDAGTMLGDVRAVLRGGSPPFAAKLAEGDQRRTLPAIPPPRPRATEPPRPRATPPSDSMIPVEWSNGSTGSSSMIPVEWSEGKPAEDSAIPVDWSVGGVEASSGRKGAETPAPAGGRPSGRNRGKR
jgi:serine/threonine-protein kinase